MLFLNSLLIRTIIIMFLWLQFSPTPEKIIEKKNVFPALLYNLNIFLTLKQHIYSEQVFSLLSMILSWEVTFQSGTQATAPWFWHWQPRWLLAGGRSLASRSFPHTASSRARQCIWSVSKHRLCNTMWLSQQGAGLGQLLSPSFLRIRGAYTPHLCIH